MINLTANESRLLEHLRNLAEPEPVCDPNGQLLGLFVPASRAGKSTNEALDAELKQRMCEKGLRPFGELVQRLKTMTEESNRRKAAGDADFTLEEARAFLHQNDLKP